MKLQDQTTNGIVRHLQAYSMFLSTETLLPSVDHVRRRCRALTSRLMVGNTPGHFRFIVFIIKASPVTSFNGQFKIYERAFILFWRILPRRCKAGLYITLFPFIFCFNNKNTIQLLIRELGSRCQMWSFSFLSIMIMKYIIPTKSYFTSIIELI